VFDNEKSFFLEKDEIVALIQQIVSDTHFKANESGKSPYESVVGLLDKYQEQPHLITPHLPLLMEPINEYLMREVDSATFLHSFCLSEFDSSQSSHFTTISKVVYALAKVVGYKTASKHLPHEVLLLRPVLNVLAVHDKTERRVSCWEMTYTLLLWLNTLSLIPFDLSSLESQNAAAEQQLSVVFMTVVRDHLHDTGPTRDLAAYCLATFLVRADMARNCLSDFLNWSVEQLHADDSVHRSVYSVHRLGVLSAVTQLLKRGDRDKLKNFIPAILQSIQSILAEEKLVSSVLERKMLCKLCQRAALILLPPREASWRYARGLRTLLSQSSENNQTSESENTQDNEEEDSAVYVPDEVEEIVGHLLRFLVDQDTVVRWSAAKGLGRICMRVSKLFGADIVQAVLEVFSDDSSDGEDEQLESSWHGGCLAVAELCRRGLVLPQMLPEVAPRLWQALVFDSSRRQQGGGASVRDAACYVCWAVARAYPPTALQNFLVQLRRSLLRTTLFDREINCRRAAAAAFQELVGRLGHANVPHGIATTALADYVSIGIRKNSFLNIAPAVAAFDPAFRDDFISFLLNSHLSHWDVDIRELSAKSLALILCCQSVKVEEESHVSSILMQLMSRIFVSDLATKHGALLGMAQVLHVCRSCGGGNLSMEVLAGIASLPAQIEQKRLFRGRGSELLREAVCRAVEAVGFIALPLPLKAQVAFVDLLNENLRQPHASVQLAAQLALRVFLFQYFGTRTDSTPSERLQLLTVRKYLDGLASEENVAVTRGFALALGALPMRLVLPQLESNITNSSTSEDRKNRNVMNLLDEFSSPDKRIAGEYDAETCRNALQAAVELTEKLLGHESFREEQLRRVFTMLFRSGQDYNVDKRGDIGSWSRIAAIQGCFRAMQALLMLQNVDEEKDRPIMTCFGIGYPVGLESISMNSEFVSAKFRFNVHSQGWQSANNYSWLQEVESTCCDQENIGCLQLYLRGDETVVLRSIDHNSLDDVSFESYLAQCINLCLQHLCEKLDTVRSAAGDVLQNLLNLCDSKNVLGDELPLLQLLNRYVCSLDEAVNWSRPEHAFPFAMQVFVGFEKYREAIVCGFITSVGSLTESISKVATQELLQCLALLRGKEGESDILLHLMRIICDLFVRMKRKDRVIIPLLKVLDSLIKNSAFCSLSSRDQQQWATAIAEHLSTEAKSCSQVSKLCTILDVQSLLLEFSLSSDSLFSTINSCICSMLGHKYPRIRKYTAELLYLNVLSGKFDSCRMSDKEKEELMDLLIQVSWESDNKVQIANGKRRTYELIGLTYVPPKLNLSTHATRNAVDELDSYETLVKEAGY
jgi:hypothetical protein